MANSDKNITLNPATDTNGDPTLEFIGSGNNPVRIRTLDDGSLTFEGTGGTLFSISNDTSGTLFSANDVSGIPMIDTTVTGLTRLAPYRGKVLIGKPSPSSSSELQTLTDSFIQSSDAVGLEVDGSIVCNGELFVQGNNNLAMTIHTDNNPPAYDEYTRAGTMVLWKSGSTWYLYVRVVEGVGYGTTDSTYWRRVELASV